MVLCVLKCLQYICYIECRTPLCDTLRQRRPAELTHCSLSSLCVVPVTLTLSNCAMAKMDVMVDLQHKPTRLVCSGRGTCHLLTPIVRSTCWNVLICYVLCSAQSLQMCPVPLPGWVSASTGCSCSLRKWYVSHCELVSSSPGSTT